LEIFAMKCWRFYGFNDMRLDDVPMPECKPGHVIVQVKCVQPSVTEAQLARGIRTLAFDRVRRRLEQEAPLPLFGHEFCVEVQDRRPGGGPRQTSLRPMHALRIRSTGHVPPRSRHRF
jgi:threonine dehydrogenase-like Zn-dependent dehydrogenase